MNPLRFGSTFFGGKAPELRQGMKAGPATAQGHPLKGSDPFRQLTSQDVREVKFGKDYAGGYPYESK